MKQTWKWIAGMSVVLTATQPICSGLARLARLQSVHLHILQCLLIDKIQITCLFYSPSRHQIPHCAVCMETAVWQHDMETVQTDIQIPVHTTLE